MWRGSHYSGTSAGYSSGVSENLLGEYLRARRGQVQPQDVGLPAGSRRRVAGLRREEVALLAGISGDYYLRLERGRDKNPSTQVVRALARVLHLDTAGTNYLLGLSAPRPLTGQPEVETATASVQQLLANLDVPGFVVGRTYDVLASNLAARALSGHLAPGHNRLRSMFLDVQERARHIDWESSTTRLVANARDHFGPGINDPDCQELITDLSRRSTRFAQLWAQHDVRDHDAAPGRFRYPGTGELTLGRVRLAVTGADRQDLILYHAPAGSADHALLEQLIRGRQDKEGSETALSTGVAVRR